MSHAPERPEYPTSAETGAFEDSAGTAPSVPDSGASIESRVPEFIGGYRIVSVLGQGGMGTVYEAEQQQPRRAVALKVVRGGRYVDEHYVRLFLRESQTLARLRHPGIACIYESGRTDDGRHFFAMELVRGEPLVAYVQRHGRDRREQLDLFIRVCSAIHYAHQRAVIHRDIKPSNILVDDQGQPKVLDFGLARITESDIAAATLVTEVGRIQGTLAYMSPEQARGNADEIDLRSDVYSLGVMLYEMVTGRFPYNVGSSAIYEIVRSICEDQPHRPRSIVRGLDGDLETILLKALAKEPSRRYHSAAAFGDDVERYLANSPILARPPSTWYQVSKLVSRNRLATALIAALFTVTVAFAVWMRVEREAALSALVRAEAAEVYGAKKAGTADHIASLVTAFVEAYDPNNPNSNRTSLDGLVSDHFTRLTHELDDQPETLANLLNITGRSLAGTDLEPVGVSLIRQALDVCEQHFDPKHPMTLDTRINLGWALKAANELDEARQVLVPMLQYEDAFESAKLIEFLTMLGVVTRHEDAAESQRLLERALAIQQNQPRPNHVQEATTRNALAKALIAQYKLDEANAHAHECLRLREIHLAAQHPHIAAAQKSRARILRMRGHYEEAARLIRQALAIYKARHGPDDEYTLNTTVMLGETLRSSGDIAGAKRILEDLPFKYTESSIVEWHVFYCRNQLAWVLLADGDPQRAERHFQATADEYAVNGLAKLAAEAHCGLGSTRMAVGDLAAAEMHLRKALRLHDKAGTLAIDWLRVRCESILGECLARLGRVDEALPILERSFETMRQQRGLQDPGVRAACQRVIDCGVAGGLDAVVERYRVMLAGTTG